MKKNLFLIFFSLFVIQFNIFGIGGSAIGAAGSAFVHHPKMAQDQPLPEFSLPEFKQHISFYTAPTSSNVFRDGQEIDHTDYKIHPLDPDITKPIEELHTQFLQHSPQHLQNILRSGKVEVLLCKEINSAHLRGAVIRGTSISPGLISRRHTVLVKYDPVDVGNTFSRLTHELQHCDTHEHDSTYNYLTGKRKLFYTEFCAHAEEHKIKPINGVDGTMGSMCEHIMSNYNVGRIGNLDFQDFYKEPLNSDTAHEELKNYLKSQEKLYKEYQTSSTERCHDYDSCL